MPKPGELNERRFKTRGPQMSNFNNARRIWTRTAHHEVIGYIAKTTEEDQAERATGEYTPSMTGVNVTMLISRRTGKPFRMNLSNLTLEELHAMKEVIDALFATALPTVILRDKESLEAENEGITSIPRNYRDVPTVVVREGPQYPDDEGIRLGPEWPLGSYPHFRPVGGVRGSSSYLPEPDPIYGGTKDNPAPTNLDQGVREVGGTPDGT